jgi:hypothetical protein
MTDTRATACYHDAVPDFVEAALERLYGNVFSTLNLFRVYGWTPGDTSTYAARDADGEVVALLLFQRQGRRVVVKNEGMRIDGALLGEFAAHVFTEFADVDVIRLNCVETDLDLADAPFQRVNRLEDMTLSLPARADDFYAGLGHATRRNIRRLSNKLRREHPEHRFEIHEGEAIDADWVRRLVDFNRARLAGKNKRSVIDAAETRAKIAMARTRGLLGSYWLDGRLAAGALCYRAGDNMFLNILAHDPAYDDYWLGFLCCYNTVRACIERLPAGAAPRQFHFLWGRYRYKTLLGAQPRELDDINIFRSRIAMLRQAGLALSTSAQGMRRRLKLWSGESEHGLARAARALLARLRALRPESAP